MDGPPGVDVEPAPAPVPEPAPVEPKHDATQPVAASPMFKDVNDGFGRQISKESLQIGKGSLDVNGDAGQTGKLDIDAVPTINDKPIYDIDLAQMEDRPWRKPGADITDYFNYGFTEDTWNAYCERQKKLRQEYNNQAAVNKALFSSINLSNPLGMPPTGGRQLVPLTEGTVKVLTDNGGIFKPHYHKLANDNSEPIVRTVIGGPPPTTGPTGPPGVKGSLDVNGDAGQTGKLDIDAVPTINDKPIYDIDLAQMEDRPWRKPGADITDYFNYGFTE
ncbi:hypothetical protein ANCDUO_08292, partial [Ancylostoma duodenale]